MPHTNFEALASGRTVDFWLKNLQKSERFEKFPFFKCNSYIFVLVSLLIEKNLQKLQALKIFSFPSFEKIVNA